MNQKNQKQFKEKYKQDIIHDVLLKNDHHITFYIDMTVVPRTIHIISGDPTKVGLPDASSFTTKTFKSFIETNNALSEVEGRETFIEDLRKRVQTMETDAQVHIPIQRKNQEPLWLLVGLECIKRNEGGPSLIVGRVNQTYETTPDAIIYYKKTYQDSLTELFTRESLKKHLNYLDTFKGTYGMYLDLDGFKQINDTKGHHMGDWFLKRLAQHFIDYWEDNVLYYRLGGDEFFVYVFNFTEEEVFNRAQTIVNDIEKLAKKHLNIYVSASIGVVPITKDNKNFNIILDDTDMCMYYSKDRGTGNVTLMKNDTLHYYDDKGHYIIKHRNEIDTLVGGDNANDNLL